MGARIRTQSNKQWRHSSKRWAYVIEEPGEPLYVSQYRYHTKESARGAGEADAAVRGLLLAWATYKERKAER